MSNKTKFAYSATADTARVAAYLTRIAEGLMSGSVTMTAEEKTINLAPSDVVQVSIEATSNVVKGRGCLVLDISWKAGAEGTHSTLEISNQAVNEDSGQATEPNPAGALGK